MEEEKQKSPTPALTPAPDEDEIITDAKTEEEPAAAPLKSADDSPSEQLAAEGDPGADDNNEDTQYHSSSGSEYEPEPESPPPKVKQAKTPAKTPKTPKTPAPKTPKTPIQRVRSGRVEKSSSPASAANGNLRCPVKGCGQTFTGRNPRQSLWHHLKYYATRGLPDKADFEKAHGEAHAEMKREAEPKGTPVERNRISSSDYRKKNPEKAKTSARLSNFRARARKKGINSEREIEEAVAKWEKEWQEKQAKEASEYFSGILLSAFE